MLLGSFGCCPHSRETLRQELRLTQVLFLKLVFLYQFMSGFDFQYHSSLILKLRIEQKRQLLMVNIFELMAL